MKNSEDLWTCCLSQITAMAVG